MRRFTTSASTKTSKSSRPDSLKATERDLRGRAHSYVRAGATTLALRPELSEDDRGCLPPEGFWPWPALSSHIAALQCRQTLSRADVASVAERGTCALTWVNKSGRIHEGEADDVRRQRSGSGAVSWDIALGVETPRQTEAARALTEGLPGSAGLTPPTGAARLQASMAGDATALAENVHGMRKGARHEAAQILLRRVHGLISDNNQDSDRAYRATNLAKHDFCDPARPTRSKQCPYHLSHLKALSVWSCPSPSARAS